MMTEYKRRPTRRRRREVEKKPWGCEADLPRPRSLLLVDEGMMALINDWASAAQWCPSSVTRKHGLFFYKYYFISIFFFALRRHRLAYTLLAF